ncbi:MAG: universal stress protein [Planctomycetota bacterium]|jgi:nucleotide-binding universal stress UspA family protein|nr:universal stress protein [Planctomycetota bacterium]MDP6988363.1 universal stress protein [Planctomycetota bacterium]
MSRSTHPRQAVVGYDGGERASHAAAAAFELHRRLGTNLEFVHAVDLPAPGDVGGDPGSAAQMEAEIEAAAFERAVAKLAALAAGARSEYPVRAHTCVARGRPGRVLLSRIERTGADLVMLGAHDRRGVLDFGSTMRAVLGKAPCAVWIQPGPPGEIRRVLVPTDLSAESTLALESAAAIASAHGAEVCVMHCFQPPDVAYAASPGYPMVGPVYGIEQVRVESERELEQVVAEFDWGDVAHFSRFVEGRPASAILELSGEFDLISMGTHGRTGLAAAVLGGVAYAVLKSADIPVLAHRQPGREMLLP